MSGKKHGRRLNLNQQTNNGEHPTNGVTSINSGPPVIGTSSFTYDSSILTNKSGNLTLIGTQSDDFILDFGPDNGAGFAIRQASNSAYNGTYLLVNYENNNTGTNPQTI